MYGPTSIENAMAALAASVEAITVEVGCNVVKIWEKYSSHFIWLILLVKIIGIELDVIYAEIVSRTTFGRFTTCCLRCFYELTKLLTLIQSLIRL